MKKFLPMFGAALLVLVGAGCQKNTVDPKIAATSAATREQQAYVFCTNKGYKAQIRFDSEVNRNRLYCTFDTGKECDALNFMDGKCSHKTAEGQSDINASLTPPGDRFNCAPVANPVCTTENKTYTNRCIAETQGKKVKHEGVCSENEEPFDLQAPSKQNPIKKLPSDTAESGTYEVRDASWPASHDYIGGGRGTSVNTGNTAAKSEPEHTKTSKNASSDEWIQNLTALLENSSSESPITVAECPLGADTYYYQKEDCSNCFKVLYTSNGEVACYPGMNDSACPNWKESNCKVIWTK